MLSPPVSTSYPRPVSYSYTLAILGLPITVRARSLTQARSAALRRYLRALTVRHSRLPVLPTLILLASDDPRADPSPHSSPSVPT